MDRRNAPAEVWGQSLGFWCRLWQQQIDQSLRFWAIWAKAFPQPTAAELAAEAEKMREIVEPEPPRKTPRAHRPTARNSTAATVH